MKILVIATDYPRPDGFFGSFFIHNRNKYYLKRGIDVSVVSFSSSDDYYLENVKVYCLKSIEKKLLDASFDILVSHAPNLKQHFQFILRHHRSFKQIIFFFHGHEVLKIDKIYPKPHNYNWKKKIKRKLIRNNYDNFKLMVWRNYFKKIYYKAQFVFVSKWLYEKALEFTKNSRALRGERRHIIYNGVGEIFEKNSFNPQQEKKFDFITIRKIRKQKKTSRDGIEIVNRIAEKNLEYSFCVIGEGNYKQLFTQPPNLKIFDKHLSHEEIIKFANQSRCALMPTLVDSQGVMMCELATFGIPLITSDLEVCREVFSGFTNVAFIDNAQEDIDIRGILNNFNKIEAGEKNKKFFAENTVGKEVDLFRSVLGRTETRSF